MQADWDNRSVHGTSRAIPNQKKDKRGKSISVFVLAIITLLLSIAGLIMSASGVPWYYENGKAEDFEECCEFYNEYYDEGGILSMIVAPMTTVFVLLICFSVPLIILFFIPMKRWLRIPLTALFGIAILTNSIFMLRRFAFMLSLYLDELEQASIRDESVDFHLHVMPYFFFLISIIALVLGLIVVKSIHPYRKSKKSFERVAFGFIQTCLITCITVLFLNPITPLASDMSDDDEQNFVFQYDAYQALESYSYGQDVDDSFGSHKTAENMVIVMVWICLSLLFVMSLHGVPKMKETVNGLTQLIVLILVFVVISVVFSILFYVNLSDIDSNLYPSNLYPHANWLIPIGCLIMLGSWIQFLILSHIPWWKHLTTMSRPGELETQQINQYQSRNIITCPNCKIQIDTSLNR